MQSLRLLSCPHVPLSPRPLVPGCLWLVLLLTVAFLLASTAGSESPVEFSFEEGLIQHLYCSRVGGIARDPRLKVRPKQAFFGSAALSVMDRDGD